MKQASELNNNYSNYKHEFTWISLRFCFWITLVSFFILDFTYIDSIPLVLNILVLIFLVGMFFSFITSIISLTKYKEKTFAIVVLVISSFWILLFLMVLSGLQGVH